MSVEIKGFKELEEDLNSLRERVEALEGESSIPFSELFTEDFMEMYSDFESIEAFLEESPWEVDSTEDFESIPQRKFDKYVDKHTGFSDWEAMLSVAAREWISRQLAVNE